MLRFPLVSLVLVGCGGSVVNDPATADGGVDTGAPVVVDSGSPPVVDSDVRPPMDTGPGPSTPGAVPPPRPTAAASGGTTKWFAVRKQQLGITNRLTGVSDPAAWKQYGYDLDSRTTTKEDSKTSASSCKRRAGSPSMVLTDGELGRDNNFGQHVMSVVKSLKSDAEESVNALILSGAGTMLLRLDNVGPADNASVPGVLFVAANLGSVPKWDGTDKWPIDTSSVDSMKEPVYKFAGGYMAGGTWVSGDPGKGSAIVPVPFFGPVPMLVPLDGAIISFDVATGAAGTIAGAANTAKFLAAMTPMMKRIGICPGNATFDQIAMTITQSADLVSGAPLFQDVSRECDAISVGIGFTAAPILPSDSYSTPSAPGPDDCGM